MEKVNIKSCCGPVRENSCGCGGSVGIEAAPDKNMGGGAEGKVLNVDLLVIDLETCERCVPTGEQLKSAVKLLRPAAEALGVDLRYRETVVRTREEARAKALVSSPTVRLNGRDIEQDVRESVCESCGELTENDAVVECREWHYRGQVHAWAPLPMLVEAIMGALLKIDEMPMVAPAPLEELPENLQRYFDNRKKAKTKGPCCC